MDKNIKSKPLVSVLMPVYNGEKHLSEAIDSILNQTYKNFEFLIIDDGSTDRSPQIISQYQKKDKRIRVITHKKNKGLVYSLNEGLRNAKGKYIARMDADDISLPSRLSKEIAYLSKNSDYVLVGTQYASVNKKGNIKKIIPLLVNDPEIRVGLRFKDEFCHGSVMFNKSVFIANDLYYNSKDKYYEDYSLWVRTIRFGKVANLDEVLYLWRSSTIGVTSIHKKEMYLGSEQLKSSLEKNYLIDKETLDLVKQSITKKYNKYIYYKHRKFKTNISLAYLYLVFNLNVESMKQKHYFKYLTILFYALIKNIRFLPNVFCWYALGFLNNFILKRHNKIV